VGAVCGRCYHRPGNLRSRIEDVLWIVRSIPYGPLVTLGLIAANTAVLVLQTRAAGAGLFDVNPGFRDGALHAELIDSGESWRIVSAGFVHADPGHLFSNMFALLLCGRLLEAALSRLQLGLLYLVALMGGSLGALILDPFVYTAGASGAIFGLFAGGALLLRTRGGSGGGVLWIVLGLSLSQNLVYTFLRDGVSVGGHVGGALVGLAAGAVMSEVGPAKRLPHHASAALVFGMSWAVFAAALLAAG
jgi:membrane associated rhomboid family serine protease